MNIFKTFTLNWWQASVFKYAMLSLGILIGMTWPDVFHAWRLLLCLVFVLSTAYVTWVWWKQ